MGVFSRLASRWAQALVPPTCAFLIARCLIHIVGFFVRWNPFQVDHWLQFDALHYLSIARRGYYIVPAGTLVDGRIIADATGNAGWFPGFSYLLRLLSPSPSMDPIVGLILSGLFAIAALAVVWDLLKPAWNAKGFLALLAVALFPGFLFMHAIFPISMFLLLSLLFQRAMVQRRWILATVLAAAATFTYSTGFVLAGVAALWLLFETGVNWRERLVVAGVIALTCLATLKGVFTIQDLQCHTQGAFFQRQAEFDNNGYCNPLVAIWHYTQQALRRPGMLAQVPIVTAGVFAAVVMAVRRWRAWPASYQILLLYAVVFWLFPFSVGSGITPWRQSVTPWRAMVVISPLAIYLRDAPRWVIYGVLTIELIFGGLCIVRYTQGAYV